ncbi:MAG TPA: membrane protein insertion efficiency factor YidD [bacterium]|nr:membrane protein insertion efficiency factor YidD [bacterium]HPP11429.1 membrane protein insertion efficiency factor YidD [bacterium]
MLDLYRVTVSPWLGFHCRFYPPCSLYARQSLEKYGLARGLILTAKRILRCHPWHPGGYDPVTELTRETGE